VMSYSIFSVSSMNLFLKPAGQNMFLPTMQLGFIVSAAGYVK
jgi:hypothetical protein